MGKIITLTHIVRTRMMGMWCSTYIYWAKGRDRQSDLQVVGCGVGLVEGTAVGVALGLLLEDRTDAIQMGNSKLNGMERSRIKGNATLELALVPPWATLWALH